MPAIAAVAAPFDRYVERGLARVELYAARARDQGAKLLVLPESALGGYLREPGPDESAPDVPDGLRLDGPEIARLIAIAGDVARAVENQVFVASANQTGRWGPLRFLGGAKVVDPEGAVLARTGAREGLAVAAIDLAVVAESRMVIDHLADRRPDAYPAAEWVVNEDHVRHRRGARLL